ncbi:MAG: site-2 protease family protein [Bilophila wadsworthia]
MLDIDLAVSIKRLSVAFVPLMLGIILHEVAHGWAALAGDPTAAMLGRLTLNPVPHIDPMGLFVFVLTSLTGPFVFGWAKPVPINPRNFRNIVKDTMLVSFAGPPPTSCCRSGSPCSCACSSNSSRSASGRATPCGISSSSCSRPA